MTVQDVEKASMDNDEPLAVRKCINGVLWDQLLAHKQYLPCSGEMCRKVDTQEDKDCYSKEGSQGVIPCP